MACENGGRLESLDVARGFDMIWIIGLSGLVVKVCGALGYGPETCVAAQMEHPVWEGLRFIDFVFPTFLFIAGISFPFSLAKQRAAGCPTSGVVLRILRRMIALFLIGLVYNGILYKGPAGTVWGSVLGRIGLGWGFAALLCVFVRGTGARAAICAAILFVSWAVGVFVAAPDNPGASPLSMEGCFAGWLDRVAMPGKLTHPGVISSQGIFSTFPAVVTAMLGVFAGEYVRGPGSGSRKAAVMMAAAAAYAALGLVVAFGLGGWSLPIIKKTWNAPYVLVCAGYSLALFAAFYYLIDVKRWWRRTALFRVIGMNAITIYLVQNLVGFGQCNTLLFTWASTFAPDNWQPVVMRVGHLAIAWALLWFLDRRKIYLKI